MPQITLSSKNLGASEAPFLQKKLNHLVSRGLSDPLTIDMRAVEFVRPAGCLALLAVAKSWRDKMGADVVVANAQSKVYAYLERADLFKACDHLIRGVTSLPYEPLSRSSKSSKILEITDISHFPDRNEHDVRAATEASRRILLNRYSAQHPQIDNLVTLISEVVQNVTHAGKPGYVMVQSWGDRPDAEQTVEISVIDLGIGVEASFRSSGTIPDSLEKGTTAGSKFLLHALEEGASSLGADRGMGLSTVDRLVRKWHGRLELRSFKSVLIVENNKVSARDDAPLLEGTHVTISVRGEYSGSTVKSM